MEARRLVEIEKRVEAGRPKRRYRRRRYRQAIAHLRPLTPALLKSFADRLPARASARDELICFHVGKNYDDSDRLAIIAFGCDQVCHVVDLGYDTGRGDVECLSHHIDLHQLKWAIARRQRRGHKIAPNELSIQLLLRFIMDINHRLQPQDSGGGAFLTFDEGWKVLTFSTPTKKVIDRVRRRLETVIWSDQALREDRNYTVHIHVQRDLGFANQEHLLQWQHEVPPEQPEGASTFWSDDTDLLNGRFFILAWHVLQMEELDALLSTEWDRHGDRMRSGGYTSESESWTITLKAATPARRVRARKRIKLLMKHWRRAATLHLSSVNSDLEYAINELKRDERGWHKLQTWAEARWHASNPSLVAKVITVIDERRARNHNFLRLCENDLEQALQHRDWLNKPY